MKSKVFISTFLFACSLFGQFETAEVLGTIHDATGGGVPKASITLRNQGTGVETKASSDQTGNYDFSNVKVGTYTVTVEAPGFSKVSAADIDVVVNARQRV